jgi:hypothetical protein
MKISNSKHPKIILFILLFFTLNLKAQDSTRLYIFSGIGVINGQGIFGESVKPSLGFNSGLEIKLKRNIFCQFSVDFNSLNYNQRNIDTHSPYLFQNTSSTLLILGLNIGYNFNKTTSKWSGFTYFGSGYLNIAEPRVILKNANTIVQNIVNQSSIFGRGGLRIGYKTGSSFFQTIYIDTSYWTSSVISQGGNVNGISILFGTRITM